MESEAERPRRPGQPDFVRPGRENALPAGQKHTPRPAIYFPTEADRRARSIGHPSC